MDIGGDYYASVLFDEAGSQREGFTTRQDSPTFQPRTPTEWIISGPHFFVATPFNKTPRTTCQSKGAYDDIDLTAIDADYVPRAVYRPGNRKEDTTAFLRKIPRWPDSSTPVSDYYRYANREMVSKGAERELVPVILPPGPTHIHTVFEICFNSLEVMTTFASAAASICYDFLVKLVGKGHCNHNVAKMLPLIQGPLTRPIMARGLRLNCLTKVYSDLWTTMARDVLNDDDWTSDNPRLRSPKEDSSLDANDENWPYELPWKRLDPKRWTWKTPVRTDFVRRQSLLEIDAMVALALGLSLQ